MQWGLEWFNPTPVQPERKNKFEKIIFKLFDKHFTKFRMPLKLFNKNNLKLCKRLFLKNIKILNDYKLQLLGKMFIRES